MLRKRLVLGVGNDARIARRGGLLRLIGTMVLAGGLLAMPTSPAKASHAYIYGGLGCEPHGPTNWISMGCMTDVTQYGNYLEFTRKYMWTAYPWAGWQAQQQLIVHSGAPCGATWLRWGLTRGQPNGQDAYAFFLAERDNTGASYWWNMGGTSWDGGNNAYYARYGGSTLVGGRYDLYKDGTGPGNVVFTTPYQGYGTCRAFAGAGIINGNYPVATDVFIDVWDTRNLQYQTTSYAWRVGWPTRDWHIDSYCPSHPNGYCFNGFWYNGTHWADNKL